jgi:hypothetical protein
MKLPRPLSAVANPRENQISYRHSMARSIFGLFVILAVSPVAHGMQIFPADVRNSTSVAVEICVEREQVRLGSAATSSEVKVVIQPGQHASVMLMGGSFGTGASFTKKITVTEAVALKEGERPAKPIAPPLVINEPTFLMEREFVVSLDGQKSQFKFEPVNREEDTSATSPAGTKPASIEEKKPVASAAAPKMYIISLGSSVDARVETARLESAYGFKAAYVYTAAAHGFAATLSQEQVEKLKAEANVLMIRPDRVVHLDPPGGAK